MEPTIKILIYIHAFFGGLGLITGLISILGKKGGLNHKKSGQIFSYSILISSLISLFVARMPNHENLFLFLIGVFTIYLVLAGNRALTLKDKSKITANWVDISISGAMLITSLVMIVLGIIGYFQHGENKVLYLFFGGFGLFLTLKDFQTYRTFRANKNAWLKSHIGRMVGALIASFTAFLVAGLHINTIIIWMLPTVFGVAYIIYWNRKIKVKGIAA